MEYTGKLYGKIGNKYFDTDKTSKDWDKMESELKELREYKDYHENMFESGDGLSEYLGGL